MCLKLARLHPLSWDKSKSLILLPVTAVLCYTVLRFRCHMIETGEEKLHSFSKNILLFQHQLKSDREAVWKIQNLVLARYQLVATSTATGETYQQGFCRL